MSQLERPAWVQGGSRIAQPSGADVPRCQYHVRRWPIYLAAGRAWMAGTAAARIASRLALRGG